MTKACTSSLSPEALQRQNILKNSEAQPQISLLSLQSNVQKWKQTKLALADLFSFKKKKALLSHWLSPGRLSKGRQLQSLADATLPNALQILTFILRFLASSLFLTTNTNSPQHECFPFVRLHLHTSWRGHESATAELSGRFTYRSNHQTCATL